MRGGLAPAVRARRRSNFANDALIRRGAPGKITTRGEIDYTRVQRFTCRRPEGVHARGGSRVGGGILPARSRLILLPRESSIAVEACCRVYGSPLR